MKSAQSLMATTLLVMLFCAASGCESSNKEYPVEGTVTWSGGNLAGHYVEVTPVNDPKTRGFGSIAADGHFRLERLVDGKTRVGVPPGSYQARIVLNDEGDGQTKKPKVPPRYLDFQKSGWTIQVPGDGDAKFTVSAK